MAKLVKPQVRLNSSADACIPRKPEGACAATGSRVEVAFFLRGAPRYTALGLKRESKPVRGNGS